MNFSRDYIERRFELQTQIARAESDYVDPRRIQRLYDELAKMPAVPPSYFHCGFCGQDPHRTLRCPKVSK